MTKFGYFVLIVLLVAVGAAGYFVVRSRNAAVSTLTPSPSVTVKPPFLQRGEIIFVDATKITVRFLRTYDVNGAPVQVYDSFTTPINGTTPVFRLVKNAQGEGYTEAPAKLSDLTLNLQVRIQLSEKSGSDVPPLFPQKITILSQ